MDWSEGEILLEETKNQFLLQKLEIGFGVLGGRNDGKKNIQTPKSIPSGGDEDDLSTCSIPSSPDNDAVHMPVPFVHDDDDLLPPPGGDVDVHVDLLGFGALRLSRTLSAPLAELSSLISATKRRRIAGSCTELR